MAINYATQFAPKVADAFTTDSLTESACGKEYQFTGAKTVKVLTVDTVPLNDYNRSGVNRYGEPVELGDTTQEMVMTDDKAFTMTIDKGNNADQMNLKGAAEAMKRETAQVVVPYIDKYRLKKWSQGAGLMFTCAAGDVEEELLSMIFDAGAAMDAAGVPLTDRTLFVASSCYKHLVLNDKLVGVDKLGEKALAKGIVGELYGMAVKRVPDSYFPNGVFALVKWKNSSADPVKLQEGKIHKDPPGLSGNLLEGRIYQDSFVLDAKREGIVVLLDESAVAETPVITQDNGEVTLTCAGAVIHYTVDGTDPRFSSTAQTYTGPFDAASGATVKAAACKTGGDFFGAVAEETVA